MPVASTPLQINQVGKLIKLVYENDKEEITKLIEFGVPHLINYNEPTLGTTALIVATLSNNSDMMKFLFSLGAHPDVVNFKGQTAAMIATKYGHVQCLEMLVNNKANMKIVDNMGRGILFYMFTPTKRHYRSYELAIKNGADVNCVDKDGGTALLVGCESSVENEEICLGLLEHGVNPNIAPTKTNFTPLMAAAKSGSVKVVKSILEKGGNPNAMNWKRLRAAHFAAERGHIDVLAMLAGFGADFDWCDVEACTALHSAARFNNYLCCRFLAQRGCNGKFKNKNSFTARMVAKEFSNKQAAKECKKGEKLYKKGGRGWEKYAITFHDWVYAHLDEINIALSKYTAEGQTTISSTYLMRALLNLDLPVTAEELETMVKSLEKGGMVNVNDFLTGKKYVKKPFQHLAYFPKEKKPKLERPGKAGKFKLPMPVCTNQIDKRHSNRLATLDFIQYTACVTDTNRFDRDLPPEHPLQDDSYWYVQIPDIAYLNINNAVRGNDQISLQKAFDNGMTVDTKDKFFKTPLMIACAQGNIPMVKMLLDYKASVTATDNFKWTPLHHACHAGQLEVAKLLLERGADINAKALNGGTPLTRAIECAAFDLVQFLIERGAKVSTESRKGLNPMDIAMSFADARVINAVIAKWSPPMEKTKKKSKQKKPKPIQDLSEIQFQKSIAAANQLAEVIMDNKQESESILYKPPKPWIQMPSTVELMDSKESSREQFGYMVDFEDFQRAFNQNLSDNLAKLG
ncbi:ankyrin repeat and EF-hand domain-containing protein 1-like [Argonauta hians]